MKNLNKSLKQKLLLAIALTLFNIGAALVFAQGGITASLHQDARLATFGDDKGNDAFTINLIARVKLQGNQDRFGYTVIYPEYEYANLKGGRFVRYSANIAYVFNTIINGFEASAGIGYGWIDRHGTTSSFSATAELAYRLSNTFKFSLLSQGTHRTDLMTPQMRFSGFFGIEVTLFNPYK